MTLFYVLLTLMLFLALIIVCMPFILSKKILTRSFFLIIFLFSTAAIFLYLLFGNTFALKQWINGGQEHYQLLTEVNQLGGMNVIIHRIQQRLADNPNDIHGWIILSKIYISEGRLSEAKKTLEKAYHIDSNNLEVRTLFKKYSIQFE